MSSNCDVQNLNLSEKGRRLILKIAPQLDLLLVEIIIGAYLLSDTNVLHIEDLGARELISILDGALSDLLIANGHAHDVGDGILVLCHAVVIIALVSVLISL